MISSPPGLTVLTIGHSVLPLASFLTRLGRHGVEQVVDVRSLPRSRRRPHFDREALAGALPAAGIRYSHLADLGGMRKPRPDSIHGGWREAGFRGFADHMETPAFEAALAALLEFAARHRTAMLCAEADPMRCHRSLIADALVVRGAQVEHVLDEAMRVAHLLRPWAKVEGGRVVYPPIQLRLGQ